MDAILLKTATDEILDINRHLEEEFSDAVDDLVGDAFGEASRIS